MGTSALLENIPKDIRSRKYIRAGAEDTVSAVLEIVKKEKFHPDRIIAMSEYDLLDAAVLREKMKLPGCNYYNVLLARDKVKMKEHVAASGIRVPRYCALSRRNDRNEVNWNGRTVLKPRFGASSQDIEVYSTPYEAIDAFFIANAKMIDAGHMPENPEDYELEEFVDGPIRHFDGLISRGRIITIMSSQYIGNCLDYAAGNPLGSYHIPTTPNDELWITTILNSLNIRDGAFHLEAISHFGELVFLEVGNRVGGADVVDTYERATGVHLPSLELAIHLGEIDSYLPIQEARNGEWYGWFVYPRNFCGDNKIIADLAARCVKHKNIIKLVEGPPACKNITTVSYSAGEVPLAGIVEGKTSFAVRRVIENLFEIPSDN